MRTKSCSYWSIACLLAAACGGGGSSQPQKVAGSAEAAGAGGAGSNAGTGPDAGGAQALHDAGTSAQGGAAGICTYDPNAGPTPGCVTGAPSTCDTAPSYKNDVAPAMQTYCAPCHRAGGMAPDKPFATYAEVFKVRTTVLSRVSGCIMPPACAEQPTQAARDAILMWLVCGAPNN